jgi:hypothetical protein
MSIYNFPDIREFEWVLIEDILNSWLSIDSNEICLGVQERTREEWNLLMSRTRGQDQCYGYNDLLEMIDNEGFIIPLPYRLNDDGHRIKCNGHHRLAVAIDLGYKYLPYVQVKEGENTFFDIYDFEDMELKSLIHPENPAPKFPIT